MFGAVLAGGVGIAALLSPNSFSLTELLLLLREGGAC